MSQVLAVFGATGIQGGSLIKHVLNDPELSKVFTIRAITRDKTSDKAKQLMEKVSVVQADMEDPPSLEPALKGAHTVFVVTTPSFAPNGLDIEYGSAKAIADTAVQQKCSYIIFSTLPAVKEISKGKYPNVTPFDAKAKAELYIRSLPIKSAFISLGFFMQNLQSQPFLAPQPSGDGTWIFARPSSPKLRIPYIDAVEDAGKVVGTILAEPNKYEGKTLSAAQALYSFEELVAILSKTTGKSVVYKEVTPEQFKGSLPFAPDLFGDAFSFLVEYGGYWGPESEKVFEWTLKNVQGKLTTLEEYLAIHPVQL